MRKHQDARQTFRNFEELTRRLIAVPRVELEKELAEYEREKRQRTTSSHQAQGTDDQTLTRGSIWAHRPSPAASDPEPPPRQFASHKAFR
jgi:hypothetical protein